MDIDLQNIIDKWTGNVSLDEKVVILFYKVRDIPYGSIGSRNFIDVLQYNKGTCSGKHQLLKALYLKLGIEVKDYIILHKFNELPVNYPDTIKTLLQNTEISDPHNFLKIKRNGKWIVVDVTWDKNLSKLGFPVNTNWDGKSDMDISVALGGEVFETKEALKLKKELLSNLPEEVQKNRVTFLKELTKWLDELREKGEI